MTHMTADQLREALCYVAETVARREADLNALDSAIGDGDHGITMRIGLNAVRNRLERLPAGAGIDALLQEASMAFMASTGGAIGVLMARMLRAAAQKSSQATELDAVQFERMLAAMEEALTTHGKCQIGDKTILDAVSGARQNLAQALTSDMDLSRALTLAAAGAEEGARRTADMLCRMGRASRLGPRALGHPDPGATSFALMLRALATWAETKGATNGFPDLAVGSR